MGATTPHPMYHGVVHREWSSWEAWTICSKTCRPGTQHRYRSCTQPRPQYGGRWCPGAAREQRVCNTRPCPVDGFLSSWGAWTTCTKTCESGTQARSRSCTPPKYGGKPCPRATREQRVCNRRLCPESTLHLTPNNLKSRTGEFDLESISFLDLSGMGELKLLETLNVSCNKLSSLDGVEELSNLSSLNVAGNMIRSIDSLSCLTKLENSKTLRLQDAVQNLANPVCVSEENYKKAVCNLLPKLRTLDGERVRGKGADLYEMCDEMDAILRDNDLESAHAVALKTIPWNTEQLLTSDSSLDRSVDEAEKGFRDVMLQCKKINEDADRAIHNATQALWNS